MLTFITEIIFSHDHFSLLDRYFVLKTSKMSSFSYNKLDTSINTESPNGNTHVYPNC